MRRGRMGSRCSAFAASRGAWRSSRRFMRILTARDRGHGPWRPGLVALLVELGMEAEARRDLAQMIDEGLDQFRDSLWLASLTYITDACAALGDEAAAALVYPELEPLAGNERDDRPAGRVLRPRRPLPGDARDDPRRLGARGEALRARDGADAGKWRRRPGSPTPNTSTRACSSHAVAESRSEIAALLGEAARLAHQIGLTGAA